VQLYMPRHHRYAVFREHMNKQRDPAAAIAARLGRVPMGIALTPHRYRQVGLYSVAKIRRNYRTTLIIDGGYLAAADGQAPRPHQIHGPSMKRRQPRRSAPRLKLACPISRFPCFPTTTCSICRRAGNGRHRTSACRRPLASLAVARIQKASRNPPAP